MNFIFGGELWNVNLRETEKFAPAPMNPVKRKEYAANVCTITEKEENFQHVILLQKLRLHMTEALKNLYLCIKVNAEIF